MVINDVILVLPFSLPFYTGNYKVLRLKNNHNKSNIILVGDKYKILYRFCYN